MTNKDRKELEPALAPLRSLVGKEDFLELAMVYIQRDKNCVISRIEKETTENNLYLRCYDIRYKKEGIVIITTDDEVINLKKYMACHPEYDWCCYLTYDDVDELLVWIQRDGEDLPERYGKITKSVKEALSFLDERKYGWWEEAGEG